MKRELRKALEHKQFREVAETAAGRKRTLGALLSLTYDADPLVVWRAVEAQGCAADRIAGSNREFVRSHLRRLHWLLSEESGGICRHAPQSMAEIVVRRPEMFADYIPIIVSLLTDMAEEDLASGFRAAVLWAIGRLGTLAGDEIGAVVPSIVASLDDADPQVRGTAVWCLQQTGRWDSTTLRDALLDDAAEFDLYQNAELGRITISALARL